MKILILSTVHPWNDPRIFHKQACTLVREHDVILAAVDKGERRSVNGVELHPLGTWIKRSDRLKLWWRAIQQVLRSRADVVHFHDPELAFLLLPWVLFSRKKLIWDVHEHPTKGYSGRPWIPMPVRRFLSWFFPHFIQFSPNLFEAVVLAEDGYLPYFPPRKNVHLIHNYALIPEPDVLWRDRFAGFDPRQELRLIYFGQLLVQRGAWKMMEMVEKLLPKYPNLRLDLVGEALPRSLGDELRQAAKKVEGRIHLHGYLDYSQGIQLVQQAHLGLAPLQPNPNHEGSMATKFYDYMILGLPFIVTDLPHWRRFIEENPCGVLAEATDSDKLAQAVIELVESPDKLRELSRNGYRLVREKFRWEGEKLLTIYRNLSIP